MNKELEKTVRYLKHLNLSNRPAAELATLASVSTKTIARSKTGINSYFLGALSPSSEERSELDDRAVRYFINTGNSQAKHSLKSLLGALCGYLLVYRSGLLPDIKTRDQAIQAGEYFLDVTLRILAYKDQSKGVPIHSKNQSLRYLKKLNKSAGFFERLFTTGKSYRAGAFSKSYRLTNESRVLLRKLGVLLKNNLLQYVSLLDKHIERLGGITRVYPLPSPSICLSSSRTFTNPPSHIELTVNEVLKLSLVSMIQVLNIAKLNRFGKPFYVPLHNLASTDETIGRTYNIFTRLRSEERLALGYHNYDMSSGIQIISFGILWEYARSRYRDSDDLIATYPMIVRYGDEPKYKRVIRKLVARKLKLTVPEVKELLTAYANGSQKSARYNALLQQFRDESDFLRREVVSIIEQHRPDIRESAVLQSKHSFPEDIDWEGISADGELAREKASVYFFIWTYFEKQIRDAMLSVVDDGIPVHDAIYSKHQIPYEDFEAEILKQTGFQVRITG
ncbi:hypothetical protein OAM26_04240 [Porticoccaceae bacterium]|nr:hypothetical protein [Porticoccaceae bacterium]